MDDGFNLTHAMQKAQGQQTADRTIAEFFADPVYMEALSKEEGRPKYEGREFVRIIIPGNRGSVVVQPVTDDVKARYPAQYEAFKKGLEAIPDGTPLTEWPPITRSMAKEYGHFHVYTVEHLAGLNDNQIQQMPMGARELVKAARLFLDAAEHGTGPLLKIIAKNAEMEAKVDQQAVQMQEMAAELAALRKGRQGGVQ